MQVTTTPHAIPWIGFLEDALKRSADQGLPVLLDFFSPTSEGCRQLDAVTYRDPAVVIAVTALTVPLQLRVDTPDHRQLVERYQLVWTPTLLLLRADGRVVHEWNGYLPPQPFLAELELGRGKWELKRDRLEEAAALFQTLADRDPTAHVAPEALYWAAAARYRRTGRPADLAAGWSRLRSRHPESLWRVRQIFSEVE
jgi:thioredoxin-like negative regulator of GroEL